VDLVLANVAVSTVVDLALPAGFASSRSAREGSCSHCGRGSMLEDRTIGTLVDVDADSDKETGDKETGSDAGQGNVFRLLAGLPIAGVLDHRVGTLTNATIEAILADPDTVFRRLMVDPDTGWLLDAGAATYQPGRHLARTGAQTGSALPLPELHCRGPVLRPRPCDPLPGWADGPAQLGVPVPPTPPRQDPRPLVRDDKP
jgi:hypothetical protein